MMEKTIKTTMNEVLDWPRWTVRKETKERNQSSPRKLRNRLVPSETIDRGIRPDRTSVSKQSDSPMAKQSYVGGNQRYCRSCCPHRE